MWGLEQKPTRLPVCPRARQTRAFTPMLKFPVHLTCMSLDYGRKAEHTKFDNKLTYKLNLDSKSKPALKIAPSRRKAKKDLPFKHGHKYKNTHTHHPFASTGALYTKTSSQFLCLLHTALAPTEQQQQQPSWQACEDCNFPPHFSCCLLALSLVPWR